MLQASSPKTRSKLANIPYSMKVKLLTNLPLEIMLFSLPSIKNTQIINASNDAVGKFVEHHTFIANLVIHNKTRLISYDKKLQALMDI